MLPYDRSLSFHLYKDQKRDYDLIWDKYQSNILQSNTDSSTKYAIDSVHTNQWYRYPAYTESNQPIYNNFFKQEDIDWMSNQITIRLKGVHPEGKNIVVPDGTILSVADSYYNSGYFVIETLKEQVILYIVAQVKNEFEMTAQNDKLTPWVQKYDLESGLRQFNGIKLNDKKRSHFVHWFS